MHAVACPLCSGTSKHYYLQGQREFLQCAVCLSVFTHPNHYLTVAAEQEHYLRHNNNPLDVRYQNFVMPVVTAILIDFEPQHHGLDFGSGTGSPIVQLLTDNKYTINQYDLFFHNHLNVLQQKYDYIACTETAEHFKEPYKEFKQLRELLKRGGKLYIMTDRFDENRDFGSWYYKTDPTHVFLYHENAFEWIQRKFGFTSLEVINRVAILGL